MALGLVAVIIGAWVLLVAREVGGVGSLATLIRSYASDQFHGTSMVFGAGPRPAYEMFRQALVWYGVPVLTWLPLSLLAMDAIRTVRPFAVLIGLSVLPAFLFHSTIHVGDPDHTLYAAPAFCLIAGAVLSRIRWPFVPALGVTALNIGLFFYPPQGAMEKCGYDVVRNADRIMTGTFNEIARIRRSGPVTLVVYDHHISWRHLYYYYPDVPVLVLHQDPRTHPDPQSAWLVYHREARNPILPGGDIGLPPGRSLWLLSRGRGMHKLLGESVALQQSSAFLAYSELRPGMRFRFGDYLISAKSPI